MTVIVCFLWLLKVSVVCDRRCKLFGVLVCCLLLLCVVRWLIRVRVWCCCLLY